MNLIIGEMISFEKEIMVSWYGNEMWSMQERSLRIGLSSKDFKTI